MDNDFDFHEFEQTELKPSSSSYSASNAKKAKREYQLLTQSDLQREVDALASECSDVVNLNNSLCKILLRCHKWDKVKMLDKFYTADDSQKFLQQLGIYSSEDHTPALISKRGLCQICLEKRKLIGLACAHLFCTDCWAQYLEQTVMSEGRVHVQCMAERCTVIVDENFAYAQLATKGDDKLKEDFERVQLNSFVQENPLIKWCPAPNCVSASKVQLCEPRRIKCGCGHIYCFNCLSPWHAPIGCKLLKVWLKQCSDDSETYNWIHAFTKDCPKCKTAIEKNGGCNHMTCKTVACRHEFCWVCLGDWSAHNGNYSCNRFSEEAKSKEKQADASRVALKRYLHYYDRYRNHENSLQFENKLYETVRKSAKQFQKANFSYVETLFLQAAVDALCESRRTLMYTYAFAFYLLQGHPETQIFEDNQQNLEAATEELSEYLERDLDEEKNLDFNKLRQKVQDKTRYVEARRIKMLQHCVENTEQYKWRYNYREINPADCTVQNIC